MICIQFAMDGTARAVYTDKIPLSELGTLAMRRASTVDWDETRQQWEVHFTDDPPGFISYASDSREECIRWEVEQLNEQLAKG